jgi:ribosomal protein S12 methylthiotransferase accessory factor
VTVLIGLAPDADSPWADIRVGEIKLLLALALGDDEAILEGCTWIAQYGQRSEARLKVYRCIAGLVQFDDPSPFEPALALMYGRETLEQAFALFNQDERFFGLTKLGSNFEGSAIHQRLLEAYRKVRG